MSEFTKFNNKQVVTYVLTEKMNSVPVGSITIMTWESDDGEEYNVHFDLADLNGHPLKLDGKWVFSGDARNISIKKAAFEGSIPSRSTRLKRLALN